MSKAIQYCANLVRVNDHEHYLTSICTASLIRPTIWTIRAFNIETSQIQDIISDTTIGKMRIEWYRYLTRWRKMIDDTFQGNPQQHPISLSLAESLQHSKLSKSWFKRVLKAREKLLLQPHFQTLEAMEQYAEETQSSLLYLHLESLGITNHAAEHAVGHLGKAIGLTLLLRSIPFMVEKGVVGLPSDIMTKYSLSTEQILRKGPEVGFHDAIFDIATRAHDQLLTARSFSKDVPPEAISALINSVLSIN